MAVNPLTLLYPAVIVTSLVLLLYGSYTDLKTRTVKTYLFVPIVALGIAYNYVVGAPLLYLVMCGVIFFFTFLSAETYAYLFMALLFIVLSAFALLDIGFYWGFQLLIISVVYAVGFQEKLFGIGDIKAIVAVMSANTSYTSVASILAGKSGVLELIPTSIAILTSISTFAVIYVVYTIYIRTRQGPAGVKGQPLAVRYDEKTAGKNPAAYKIQEKDGVKYMIYRVPFIIPILLGYVLFLAGGFWPYVL